MSEKIRGSAKWFNEGKGFGFIFISEEESKRNQEEYRDRCMKKTLEVFRRFGLTESLLRQNWEPFTPSAYWWQGMNNDAFIYLVTGQIDHLYKDKASPLLPKMCLTSVNALHEMSRLSSIQLCALVRLYSYGLRGEHLRKWHGSSPKEWFSSEHENALVFLVIKNGLTIEEGLQRITGISTEDAKVIEKTIKAQDKKEIEKTASVLRI